MTVWAMASFSWCVKNLLASSFTDAASAQVYEGRKATSWIPNGPATASVTEASCRIHRRSLKIRSWQSWALSDRSLDIEISYTIFTDCPWLLSGTCGSVKPE